MTPDWSVKGEYQYIDLGNSSGYFGLDDKANNNIARDNVTIDREVHTVRAGLNYHLFQEYEPLR